MWLRRMERATERSAHLLQVSHAHMPYGRDIRPRSQRRTETPVSARSGSSAISERDMLHAVLMANADGQVAMRADEDDAFRNMPLSSAQRPHVRDECPSAWIFEKIPIAEEEAHGCINVFTPLARNDWVLGQRRRKG
eukprot:6569275-Pyramimonas_sp.AAC.1